MKESELFASFWGHVEALRHTFLRIFFIVLSATGMCFVFHEAIFSILISPLVHQFYHQDHSEALETFRISNSDPKIHKNTTLETNSVYFPDFSHKVTAISDLSYQIAPGGFLIFAKAKGPQKPVLLGPLEGIYIALKTSFWLGLFVSSPIWLFMLARFILPGLHQHERRLVVPFTVISLLFIALGCCFAFHVTIPIANQYLAAFNGEIGVNLWSLSNYLDYTLFLLMANGIAFECFVIGIFAIHLQLVSAEGLTANRRFAILSAFVFAALVTPPDVLTQFMLAIPLCVFYEALILYARIKKSDCSPTANE